MGENRGFPAQSLIEQNVFGGAADPFLSPDHVSDSHEVVIHHVGQVISRIAV